MITGQFYKFSRELRIVIRILFKIELIIQIQRPDHFIIGQLLSVDNLILAAMQDAPVDFELFFCAVSPPGFDTRPAGSIPFHNRAP